MKKATRQYTKEHNRDLVLKTIFDHQSISRADIARATSLTRTTVSDIVSSLINEGLVSEIGVGESQGGKNPILLSLEADSRYLIGIDLAQSEFRGAIVNLRGQICKTISTPVDGRCGDEALALVYQTLDSLLAEGFRPLVGIGVGTPGLVDPNLGTVINAVNLDWQDLPLAKILRDRYRLPVGILNDSHAAALGEYTYGVGKASEGNLVVVNARHGLGAGIVIHGRLFQGDGGGAGEIGHVAVVKERGIRCRCGNYGCLETVASATAIIRQAKELGLIGADDGFKNITQAFFLGDPQVKAIVLDAGRYMGMAISALVGTLNIQHVVLSGDLTIFGAPWLDAIRETLNQSTLSWLAKDTRLEIGTTGKDSILLGASAVIASNSSHLFLRQPAR